RVSHTFLDILRFRCSVHGYPARRAARAADPGDSPRSCSTFREGALEGLREWNPNRPMSEMAADRDLIRESFEKQPVRTVAEACERTLATQRSGTGIGEAVRNHVVVPAAVFAQSEPDRTTVEVHHTSRPLRPLPADLRSVSSCHPRGSRRSFNHSRRKAEVADDAQVPAIRRCFTHGRVRFSGQGIDGRCATSRWCELGKGVSQAERDDDGQRHEDEDDVARAWLRQEVADLLPESFEPALGDGRRFERLTLRALLDQGTFQLDQFLTVFLLNTPARFDTLVLEVSTVRV